MPTNQLSRMVTEVMGENASDDLVRAKLEAKVQAMLSSVGGYFGQALSGGYGKGQKVKFSSSDEERRERLNKKRSPAKKAVAAAYKKKQNSLDKKLRARREMVLKLVKNVLELAAADVKEAFEAQQLARADGGAGAAPPQPDNAGTSLDFVRSLARASAWDTLIRNCAKHAAEAQERLKAKYRLLTDDVCTELLENAIWAVLEEEASKDTDDVIPTRASFCDNGKGLLDGTIQTNATGPCSFCQAQDQREVLTAKDAEVAEARIESAKLQEENASLKREILELRQELARRP